MISSLILFFGIIIAGFYGAFSTIGTALTENKKLNIAIIRNSVYFDIVCAFIIYSFLPISFALVILNIITIKFIILSIIDYDMMME